MYIFQDDLVWTVENSTNRPRFPTNISHVFPGIEGPVTAAMTGTNNKVYFFRFVVTLGFLVFYYFHVTMVTSS